MLVIVDRDDVEGLNLQDQKLRDRGKARISPIIYNKGGSEDDVSATIREVNWVFLKKRLG